MMDKSTEEYIRTMLQKPAVADIGGAMIAGAQLYREWLATNEVDIMEIEKDVLQKVKNRKGGGT